MESLKTDVKQSIQNKDKNTYEKRGATGIEGNLCQNRLITLFLLGGLEKGYSFRLGSEVEGAGKLDDVVFIYYNAATQTDESVLLQAKHFTDDSKHIGLDGLLSEGDVAFGLVKYFNSFQDIKKNKSFGKIVQLVVYTNLCFSTELSKFVQCVSSERENILNFDNKRSNEKNKLIGHYQFNNFMKDKLKSQLENYALQKLANTFIDDILTKPYIAFHKGDIYSNFVSILTQDVFEINDKKIKFLDKFINNEKLTNKAQIFRDNITKCTGLKSYKFRKVLWAKKEELLKLENMEPKTKSIEKIIQKLRCLMISFKNPLLNEKHIYNLENLNVFINTIDIKISGLKERIEEEKVVEWPENWITDEEIEEFLQLLIYSVGQPNESMLKNIIIGKIRSNFTFKHLTSDMVTNHLEMKILDWFKKKPGNKKNEGNYLTNEHGEDFLNNILLKDLCRNFMEGVKFEPCSMTVFKDTLFSSQQYIIHVTSLTSTHLTMAKLYHTLEENRDKCLFLDDHSLSLPEVSKTMLRFHNLNIYTNIIIECTTTTNFILLDLIFSKTKLILKETVIVIISHISNNEINTFLTDKKPFKITDETTFQELSKESRDMLLNKSIEFQGKSMQINKFINGDSTDIENMMRSDTLVKLINGEKIKIGKIPLRLHDLEVAYTTTDETISPTIFKKALLKSCLTHIYVISGLYHDNVEIILRDLNNQLQLLPEEMSFIKKLIGFYKMDTVSNDLIVLLQDQDKENQKNHFRNICHFNSKKIIFWLDINSVIQLKQIFYAEFYMKRKFFILEKMVIKKSIKDEILGKNNLECFLLTGSLDEKNIKDLLSISEFSDEDNKFNEKMEKGFIILKTEIEAEQTFLQISKKQKVHWISTESSELVWRCSHGPLEVLRGHIDKRNLCVYGEEGLTHRLMILADEPGMGKSTTLIYLIEEMLPTKWVILVDLKNSLQYINKLPTNEKSFTLEIVIRFLNDIQSTPSSSDLLKMFLKYYLETKKDLSHPLLILFDGFDEVDEQLRNKVLAMLRWLKDNTFAALWVTTRQHLTSVLEDTLSIFATTFLELDWDERKEYLKKNWQVCTELVKNDPEKLALFVNKLLDESAKIFTTDLHFLGVPLQLRLLLEGFRNQTFTFMKGDNKEITNLQTLTLLALYDNFVKERFNIYLNEKSQIDPLQKINRNILEKSLNNGHELHSLSYIFPSEIDFKNSELDLPCLLSVGIIRLNENNVDYIHRTFAEFFCAKWFVEHISNIENITFLYDKILKEKMVRTFINLILIEKNSLPLHFSILKEDLEEVGSYIYNSENILSLNEKDPLGRTALHLAAQEDFEDIIKVLLIAGCDSSISDNFGKVPLHYSFRNKSISKHFLSNLDEMNVHNNISSNPFIMDREPHNKTEEDIENNILLITVNKQDVLEYTPLHYTFQEELWDSAIMLVVYGANLGAQEEKKINLLWEHVLRDTKTCFFYPYHLDYNKTCNIYLALSSFANFINPKKENVEAIAQYLFQNGEIKIIDKYFNIFLESGILSSENLFKYLLLKNENKLNDFYNLQFFKYFIETKAVNLPNEIVLGFLTSTAALGHIESFLYLLKYYSTLSYTSIITYILFPINIATSKRNILLTGLNKAVVNDHLGFVKDLHSKYNNLIDDDCNTILHYAACSGSLQCIRYLCESGTDVNCTNINGDTSLHCAVRKGFIEVVEYLVKQGANVNQTNKMGDTPLDCTFCNFVLDNQYERKKRLLVIKYLITNCQAVSYKKSLETEITHQIIGVKPAEIKKIESKGHHLLHAAVGADNLPYAAWLLNRGSFVNALDNQGRTPLYYAQSGFMTILLFQNGADYTQLSNYGTLTGIAEIYESLNTLFVSKILLSDFIAQMERKMKINIDDWFSDNFTLYNIINVSSVNNKTLLNRVTSSYAGSDVILRSSKGYGHSSIYACNRDQNDDTPLHSAVMSGNVRNVSLLLEHGACFNFPNKSGKTPEDLAKEHSYNDIIELFENISQLFSCIENNNIFHVQKLINKGVPIETRDKHGATVYHLAALLGNLDVMHILMKKKRNTDTVDFLYQTPLHAAAQNNQISMIALLMQYGAAYDSENKNGEIPADFMNIPDSENLLWIADKLFKHVKKSDANSANREIQLLLKNSEEARAVFSTRDCKGNTVLHYAIQQNLTDTIYLLLKNGAPINAKNNDTILPYELAAHDNIMYPMLKDIYGMLSENNKQFINMSKFLKTEFQCCLSAHSENENKINIILNVRNTFGETILHKISDVYILKYLLSKGIDMTSRDLDGRTALGRKTLEKRLDLVVPLHKAGASLQQGTYTGDTPLHDAAVSQDRTLFHYLVAHGASVDTKNNLGLIPDNYLKDNTI